MSRTIAALAIVMMAACAPDSELPVDVPPWISVPGAPGTYALFNSCDAARPFEVGETMIWRWRGDARQDNWRVENIESCSHQDGGAPTSYTLAREGAGPMGWNEFFAVENTPEEDYIVQTITPNEDYPSISYAFIWRTAEGWGATAAQSYDDLSPRERRYCIMPRVARPHPRYVFGCAFASTRQVIGYYREVVYPQVRSEIGDAQ